jgi:phosphoglycerate kinase
MEKELEFLVHAVEKGKRPLAALIGGAKISTKITVLEKLLDQCDKIAIGGGMAFTFLKAQGYSVGSSLCEEEYVSVAKGILEKAQENGKKILLPVDLVVADKFAADANTQIVRMDEIPDGWMGLDVGPLSIQELETYLSDCKTILMNGPMGVFEFDKFSKGTMELINILAALTQGGSLTIIGGGDSVAAVELSGKGNLMTHISTGGGASLELLEGKLLPGVEVLEDKE